MLVRTISLLLIAVLPCLVSAPVLADEGCAELVARWGRGPSWDVVVNNGVLFYGSGTQLVAISAAGVEIGRLDLGGVVHDVEITNGTAFVVGKEKGLITVDVSDPTQMSVLALTEEPPNAEGVTVTGATAVVTDPWRGISIFDVSDPAQPALLLTFDPEGNPGRLDAVGSTVAVCLGSEGVLLLDVADPSNPQQHAVFDTEGDATGVTLDGTLAYVADGQQGLLVLDVGDPSSPSLIGSVVHSGHSSDVALAGTTAWVAADYGGFFSVDVTDPASPAILGSANLTMGTETRVAADGTRVWFATYTQGVAEVDGSDPTQPVEVARYQEAGEIRSVAALGDNLVVADWSGLSLRILDPAAEGGPTQIGAIALPGYVRHAAVASNRAYVALEWADFVVVDLEDPTRPELIGALDVPGSPQHVALAGNFALVSVYDEGLQIVDITHPDAPSILAAVEIPGLTMAATVVGSTAYVAAGSAGLVTVDISSPSNPNVISVLDLNTPTLHVAVRDGFAYVAGYYAGFFVVDISDPANPVLAGEVDVSGEARGVVVDGDLAYVSDRRWGLLVIDISDPTSPAAVGWTETPGSGWFGTFVGDRFAMADDDAGVALFDVTPCGDTPDPPHADFTYAPQNPRAGDVVQFTDLSTGDPAGWSWLFLDDLSRSSEQNPTHVFETAGAHQVELEVWNDHGSTNAVRTVVVEPAEGELPPVSYPFAFAAVVSASAHAGGAQGTSWVTDLVLHNTRNDDVKAWVFFLETGENGSGAEPVELVVPAGQSVLLADVVLSSFGHASATGAIVVGAEQSLIVSSRTYNDSEDGTFGQYIPGTDRNQSLQAGVGARLIQLTEDGSFRSNIGVANVGSEPIDVAMALFSADGQYLTTRYLTVEPWSHEQLNAVFGTYAPIADGYAVVESPTIGARWFTYASVVDNRSGDPVYVAPVEASSEPLWIVASAHVEGSNNTNWRTDLEMATLAKDGGAVELEWLSSNGGEPTPISWELSGDPCERIDDVVAELFGVDGAGALKVTSSAGSMAMTSRTYNDPGDATYGQYIPAVPDAEALIWGDQVRLVQLAHSPSSGRGYRTNIGFVNTTGAATTVYVSLYDGDGTNLDTREIVLNPWQYRQINNIFAGAADRELANAFAVVSTSTGGAAYFTYASVVDNRSGDPIFIPAVREP